MRTIIVAVDGPAGSGKSSISRAAALATGLVYVDSGALYRAATLFFLREGFPSKEPDISKLDLSQVFMDDGSTKTYLRKEEVTHLLRDEDLLRSITEVASLSVVRDRITSFLRNWAAESSLIMDGRDIGSVVFPDADLKIYLDASVDVRAERRADEYAAAGKNVDFNSIKKQIILRDSGDINRKTGALVRCSDAVYLDSSDMTQEEVLDFFVDKIKGVLLPVSEESGEK